MASPNMRVALLSSIMLSIAVAANNLAVAQVLQGYHLNQQPVLANAVGREYLQVEPDGAGVALVTTFVGSMGMVSGALIGFGYETRQTDCESMFCGVRGVIYGGLLGGTIAIPVGAHLGGGQWKRLPATVLLSASAMGAGYLLSRREGAEAVLFVVPLTQVIISLTNVMR